MAKEKPKALEKQEALRSKKKSYYVYIVASKTRVLYVGITSDIRLRLTQHREGLTPGFASKYMCHSLVYLESFPYVRDAIAREKQLKGWTRKKKIALIQEENPDWKDLTADWVWW